MHDIAFSMYQIDDALSYAYKELERHPAFESCKAKGSMKLLVEGVNIVPKLLPMLFGHALTACWKANGVPDDAEMMSDCTAQQIEDVYKELLRCKDRQENGKKVSWDNCISNCI